MNDAALVGSVERMRDLRAEAAHVFDRKGAARQPRFERLPLDRLHHDDLARVEPFDTVDSRDVGMIQRCEGVGFAVEARDAVRIVRKRFRQELEGDVAAEAGVACAIDRTHSACTQFADDPVRTKRLAFRGIGGVAAL